MSSKIGDSGTTLDGAMGQTQEIMPEATIAVAVPTLDSSMQTAPDHRAPTAEQLEDLRRSSKLKLEFMERQYWLMRNGKQDNMMCPYCLKSNFEDVELCCNLFTKAFGAILERQHQVDIAAGHVRTLNKVGLVH